jgi:hypothetical protein
MQLLIAHLVGDYLFQNRWMALNKHENADVCILHSLIYAISVSLICGMWSDNEIFKFLIIFVSHFIIDYFRIGAKWRQFFSHDTEIPWTILSDNTIHLLILWGLSLV